MFWLSLFLIAMTIFIDLCTKLIFFLFTGLVAMILTFLSFLGGIINLLSMNFGMKTVIVRFVRIGHAALGSLTISSAFLALCFGFNHAVYRNLLGDLNANIGIALTVCALVGTLLTALLNTLGKLFCC